ncbi:hypothetical protein EMPS_01536 [Entomortierella parvispora]|uniref:Uncharacterized protein n=1 Tax=Entomortierella parvispora TaxID=205924 RepID=A0A9P3LT20_9FUNG|nr:hypothetical protein EMPS_01536 [Entomortierella parvispora]
MQSPSPEQSLTASVAIPEASSPRKNLRSNVSVTQNHDKKHCRQLSFGHGGNCAHSQHRGHQKNLNSHENIRNHCGRHRQESGSSRSLRHQMKQLKIAPSNSSLKTTESSLQGPSLKNFFGAVPTSVNTPNDTANLPHRNFHSVSPFHNSGTGQIHHRKSNPNRRRSRIDRSWKKEALPSLALSLPLPGQAHFQPHRRHHRHPQTKAQDDRNSGTFGSHSNMRHLRLKSRGDISSGERGRASTGNGKEDIFYEKQAILIGHAVDDRDRQLHHRRYQRRGDSVADASRCSQKKELSEGGCQAGFRAGSDRGIIQDAESTQAHYSIDSASPFSTPSPPVSQLLAMILELTRALWIDATQVTGLVLSESLLGGADMYDRAQLLIAVRKIPRLTHFASNTRVANLVPGLLETLLEYHHPHLVSFQLVDYPLQSITIAPQEETYCLNERSALPVFDSQKIQARSFQVHHGSSDFMAMPETLKVQKHQDVQEQHTDAMPLICCHLLECCPNLQLFESSVPLPLDDLIAFVPRWASASTLTVLRIEIQEFSGANALDMEEETVMQMFVKSLFMGNWSPRPLNFGGSLTEPGSSTSSGSDSGMSGVGSGSRNSNNSSGSYPTALHGSKDFLLSCESTDSGSGYGSSSHGFSDRVSSTKSVLGLSSGSSDTCSGMAFTSSLSQLGSGAMSSMWPARSPSPLLPTMQTGASPVQYLSPCTALGKTSVDRPNGYFAVEASPPVLLHESKESFVGVANFSNASRKMTHSRGAIYHPSELLEGLPSPIPPAPPPLLVRALSGLHGSPPRPLFAGANHGYSPIVSVGRLVALQFLVEHQLVYLPKLDRFFLGNRLYKIPTRR